MPFETTGDKGTQIGVYTKQQFTEKLSGSLLLDYNFKPNSIYSEPELSIKLKERINLFGQLRIFAPLDDAKEKTITPLIGFKFRF